MQARTAGVIVHRGDRLMLRRSLRYDDARERFAQSAEWEKEQDSDDSFSNSHSDQHPIRMADIDRKGL
jgi:hypothetical protein